MKRLWALDAEAEVGAEVEEAVAALVEEAATSAVAHGPVAATSVAELDPEAAILVVATLAAVRGLEVGPTLVAPRTLEERVDRIRELAGLAHRSEAPGIFPTPYRAVVRLWDREIAICGLGAIDPRSEAGQELIRDQD